MSHGLGGILESTIEEGENGEMLWGKKPNNNMF